jgi:hypothetical protein
MSMQAMLSNVSRTRWAGRWCAAVTVVGACGVVGGAAITTGNGELWLIACLMPPAVMLLVWRNPVPADVSLAQEP